MKRIILSVFAIAAFASAITAQTVKTTPVASTTTATDDNNKTKVDPATLPDAVKATLASDAYKAWTVTTAWLVKGETDSYVLEMKKEDKTTTLNIDKDGKVK